MLPVAAHLRPAPLCAEPVTAEVCEARTLRDLECRTAPYFIIGLIPVCAALRLSVAGEA